MADSDLHEQLRGLEGRDLQEAIRTGLRDGSIPRPAGGLREIPDSYKDLVVDGRLDTDAISDAHMAHRGVKALAAVGARNQSDLDALRVYSAELEHRVDLAEGRAEQAEDDYKAARADADFLASGIQNDGDVALETPEQRAHEDLMKGLKATRETADRVPELEEELAAANQNYNDQAARVGVLFEIASNPGELHPFSDKDHGEDHRTAYEGINKALVEMHGNAAKVRDLEQQVAAAEAILKGEEGSAVTIAAIEDAETRTRYEGYQAALAGSQQTAEEGAPSKRDWTLCALEAIARGDSPQNFVGALGDDPKAAVITAIYERVQEAKARALYLGNIIAAPDEEVEIDERDSLADDIRALRRRVQGQQSTVDQAAQAATLDTAAQPSASAISAGYQFFKRVAGERHSIVPSVLEVIGGIITGQYDPKTVHEKVGSIERDVGTEKKAEVIFELANATLFGDDGVQESLDASAALFSLYKKAFGDRQSYKAAAVANAENLISLRRSDLVDPETSWKDDLAGYKLGEGHVDNRISEAIYREAKVKVPESVEAAVYLAKHLGRVDDRTTRDAWRDVEWLLENGHLTAENVADFVSLVEVTGEEKRAELYDTFASARERYSNAEDTERATTARTFLYAVDPLQKGFEAGFEFVSTIQDPSEFGLLEDLAEGTIGITSAVRGNPARYLDKTESVARDEFKAGAVIAADLKGKVAANLRAAAISHAVVLATPEYMPAREAVITYVRAASGLADGVREVTIGNIEPLERTVGRYQALVEIRKSRPKTN